MNNGLALLEAVHDIHNLLIKLETARPTDVVRNKEKYLSEATDAQNRLLNSFSSMQLNIETAMKRFNTEYTGNAKESSELIDTIRGTNINAKDLSKEIFTIHQYWIGMRNMNHIRIPRFDFNQADVDEPEEFKQTFFNDLLTPDRSQYDKEYFRGPEKEFKGGAIKTAFSEVVKVLLAYDNMCKKLEGDVRNINATIGTVKNYINSTELTEGALINMSDYKDEFGLMIESTTFDNKTPLLEAAESKEQFNQKIKYASLYIRECYVVCSLKMSVMDEAFGKCLQLAVRITKLKNKEA